MLISASLLVMMWGRVINHDTAWYLIATREWLEGARLYVDIYEVNPPLNFYFTVPPVLLADLLGISDTNAQYSVLCLLMFASLFWSWTVLTEKAALSAPRQVLFLIGLGMALVFPALNDVAQREHLLVLFAAPWLLGQLPAGREPSTARIVARAAFAALGICLKPFFIVIPVCVTSWHMLRERSVRPAFSLSNMTMFAIGLGYVLAARLLHPEYFLDVIPVARQVYGSIGLSNEAILVRLTLVSAPFAQVALLLFFDRRLPRGTGLFGAATLAGLGSYLWQWSGFGYHLVPLQAFGLLACLWILVRAQRVTPMALAAAAAVLANISLNLHSGPYKNSMLDELAHTVASESQPRSVFTVSTDVAVGPPLALALRAKWASRYPHNWLVPGALNGLRETDCAAEPGRCERLTQIADRSRDDHLADIARRRPDVLVIDNDRFFITDPGFSWRSFLDEDPRWSALLARYRRVRSMPRFDIWMRCASPDDGYGVPCPAPAFEPKQDAPIG